MMNTCKRIVVAMLVALGLTAVASRPAMAFTDRGASTMTATVGFTGVGTYGMTTSICNVSDNLCTPTQLAWPSINVDLSPGWVLSNQYIKINSTVTQSGSGIQIYTSNMSSGASPLFTGISTMSAAGLVNAGSGLGALTASIAWSVKGSTSAVPAVDAPYPAAVDANSFQWSYFLDPATYSLATWGANATDYVTVKKAGYGIHYSQGAAGYGSAPSPNYVYVELDASNVMGTGSAQTYTTNRLIVELFSN
jgi:hypothetical protein